MVCIRCQKRPAIIFIQRMVDGQMKQEGYCLHCARELHIKPVDDLMKQFGMSDQDLDNMENRMESMMEELGDSNPLSMMMNMTQGGEDAPDEDEDLIPGSNATFPLGFTSSEKQDGDKKGSDRKNGKKPPKRKFLDTYCENLTRKAREGKLDDIIGRDREIYRTIQILSRRQKNNPCLIGEAGVGKTAIAEGIAERIAKGDVPIGLQDKEIYLLDLTSLVAGTQFRGQFEQRVKGLLGEVKAAGNVILFIDEIHTITSAGESEGAMNAGNILKPALSRGEIQVIGATTFTEYRKYIEKDQALERRFQPVRVEEPSVADTLAVMNGIKHYYEQHHHVQVPADVRFTLKLTNNSSQTAKNVTLYHGATRITTVSELAPSQTVTIERDFTISQAGKFRFTASIKDALDNTQTFDSNEITIAYAAPTAAPTAVPQVTVAPLVTVTVAPIEVLEPVASQTSGYLRTAALVFAGLFGVSFLLFAVSTVMRAKRRSTSRNAYDHMDLAERRDYTEPARYGEADIADTEPETAPDALSEKPSDEILKEDVPQPVKQQSDDGGAYRLTREDSQPQPQASAQDQPAQDTPAEEAVDAPSRRRRANRKPADAPSEDE